MTLLRAARHNTRDRVPPNADPARVSASLSVAPNTPRATADDAMRAFDALRPARIRKNAVLAIEIILTHSPEAFAGDTSGSMAYLRDASRWAIERFGGPGNVLLESVHLDETTNHTHLLMIPLKDGKLNARHFIGGSRDVMRRFQDEFYETVGSKHGLERGRPREETKARHTDQHGWVIEKKKLRDRVMTLEKEVAHLRQLTAGLYKER